MAEFPSEIKGYSPICLCGRGAYGQVWLVSDVVGNRRALKVVSKSMLGGNWEREFKGLRNYHTKVAPHPNLIQVYHIEDCGDFFYYTMEAADNLDDGTEYIACTLENMIQKRGALGKESVVAIFDSLLDGLEHLHNTGLVHRDIKPDNIVFVNGVPKLSDIGLISSVSQTLSLAGTQSYVPPEVLTGQQKILGPFVDIYALGKSFYRAFSGQQPDDFPVVPHRLLQTPFGKSMNRLIKYACHPSPKLRIDKIAMFRKLLRGQIGFFYKIKILLYFIQKIIGNIYFAIILILAIVAILLYAIWGPIVNSFTPKTMQEHMTWTPNNETEFTSLRQKPNRSHSDEIKLMQLMEKLNNITLSNNKSKYEITEAGNVNRQYVKVYEEYFDYGAWRFNSKQEPPVITGFRFGADQSIDMILNQALPNDFQIAIELNIPENSQGLEISILSEESVVFSQRTDLFKKVEQLAHCSFTFRITPKGTFSELSYINSAVVSSSALPAFKKIQPIIPQSYIGKNQLLIIKTGYNIRIYANGRELFSRFDFPWGKNYLRLRCTPGKSTESIFLASLMIHDIKPTNGRGQFRLPLPPRPGETTMPKAGKKER